MVTGSGLVNGRQVFAYAQDFTVLGGSLSEVAAQKICKVMDHAVRDRLPHRGYQRLRRSAHPGGGGLTPRLRRDFSSETTLTSGVVPQITVIAGPAAGGAVYSPAITDFIFMVESIGQMYITGPDVVRAVTGEEVSHEELGGAMSHASRSGVAPLHRVRRGRLLRNRCGLLLSYFAIEQHRVAANGRIR